MFERDSTRATMTCDLIDPGPKTAPCDTTLNLDASSELPAGERSSGRFLHGWYWRILAVLVEVGAAFFIREAFAFRDPRFAPFITFYPAVLLACLLDGVWAGIAVTVLCTLVAEIWIFPPLGHLAIHSLYDGFSLAIFFAFGISLSIVVELYHRNREKLAAYLVKQAVAEEHRKQEDEHKLAELIQTERQRLFEVMEALPAMVSLRRPDHLISFANRSFREKFGDPEERRCFEMRHGRTEPCEDCETFLPLENGETHHREVSFPDHTLMEAYDFPFKDLDGSPLVLEMGLDITDRRRAEDEVRKYREHLEELVTERTRQLETVNAQLAGEIRGLEQAQQRIREDGTKLETALSSMMDSVVIADAKGQFIHFNEAFASLYRFRSKRECAKNFTEFSNLFEACSTEGEPVAAEMYPMWRALRGESASKIEYAYRHKETGECWIASLSFSPIRGEDGAITGAVITARDVTDRKQAERELAEARLQAEQIATQLRTIFDNVDERLYVCDQNGNTIMANGVTRQNYPDSPNVPSLAELEHLLEVSDMEGRILPLAEWPISRVLRGERVRSAEIRVRFKTDKDDRILTCNGSPIRDEGGNILMAVLTSADVTERKHTEEALRRSEKIALQREQFQALAERLRRAREEERTRVSRDLHDQIGQMLTAIKLDLTWMSRRLPKGNDEFGDRLNGTIGLLNEGVRSVRKICSGLRPGVLDDLGLAAAIEWQANEFAARTGIDCTVSVPASDLMLSGDQATEFFRIFQECLTNVIRHAEANSVRVALSEDNGQLILLVADDGKGFREADVSGSLGFLGMKERAQVCGGSLEVASLMGHGTTVTLRVPLYTAVSGDGD